jgi:VWFA-related protein
MVKLRLHLVTLICCLAPAMLAAQTPQPPAAEGQPVFHSAADVVTIHASVRDKRGRPLTGLNVDDFEVLDNGQTRPILSLHSDVRSPITVAILVDMSGSMRMGSKIDLTRRTFEAVLSQLRAGQDEVELLTFDSELHERRGFTQDIDSLRGALTEFEAFGTTSLYDATAETARRIAQRPATHKAIIVLTDGVDTSSTLTGPEVSGLASSIDVPVYVVATVSAGDQRAMIDDADRTRKAGAVDLRDLAEWTGGQLVFSGTLADTAAVTSSLIAELRQQYVLAIEAASGRQWRRLGIHVKDPKANVRARSGYFAG